jgi:hypothetical protein
VLSFGTVRPSRPVRRLLVAVCAAMPLAACGPSLARAPAPKAAALDDGQRARQASAVADGDRAWAGRADRALLEAAIAGWERALTVDGRDWQTAIKLSRALHLLADGWLAVAGDRDGRIRTLERGMQAAETGMAAASPAFAAAVTGGADVEDAAGRLSAAHVGLVYWYASNLGSWIDAQGRMAGMKYRGRIEALMRRVHTLDPTYHFHGADRFFGAYYAALPGFLGGSVAKCEQHFLAAQRGAPEFPGTYLLMAQFLAPAKNDPAAFDRYLAAVLDAQACTADGPRPCIAPGLEPEVAIDQKKARALAQRKSDLF